MTVLHVKEAIRLNEVEARSGELLAGQAGDNLQVHFHGKIARMGLALFHV